MGNIKRLFEPQSVAIIGASKDPKKIGYTVVANILSSGFKGKIYPVNPSGGEIPVIITNGGGIGVMATDACEKYSIDLYDDGKNLKTMFSPVTPSFGSTKNPIDITGGAAGTEYNSALKVTLEIASILETRPIALSGAMGLVFCL